ncbi:unnamed protein product [Owenia fusiformis]|uniref:Immunoglobulin domain-containing protein n=1 Tax=Owenia fusiformis TaxID=6347 RepID=A0A8J1UCC2_OWEFU|nr:unnamed protein product [Owenia fusiformis]
MADWIFHFLGALLCVTGALCQTTIDVEGPTGPVLEGETVTFTCTISPALPKFQPPHVIKYVDSVSEPYFKTISGDAGQKVNSPFEETGRYSIQFEEVEGKGDVGTITITNVKAEDGGGSIGCSVPSLPNEPFSVTALEVLGGPKQVYFSNMTDGSVLHVKENDRVNLECHSNGSNPAPELKVYLMGRNNNNVNLTETWARSSTYPVPIDNNDGLVKIMHHVWLHNLEKIEYLHNKKNLRCEATVPGLPTKSSQITIDVLFAPKFNCSRVQYPEPGNREARISCDVAANPDLINDETIVQWQWTENENMQTLNPKINQMNGEYRAQMMRSSADDNIVKVELEITPLDSSHYRQYNIYISTSDTQATYNITLAQGSTNTAPSRRCSRTYIDFIITSLVLTLVASHLN